MANIQNCCVSGFVADDCHTHKYRSNKSMQKINSLLEELQFLYLRIAGLKEIEGNEGKPICDYHYRRYIRFYSSAEYKCCDPWNGHAKKISLNLIIIDL